MAKHGGHVQGRRGLIQSPQGFCIIGIQFEELSDESLRDLSSAANPCGPEPETAPVDPVWLFPDVGVGQSECRPERDGPWPEHGASRVGGQSAAITVITAR